MSSKFFTNKNDKKVVAKGVKPSQPKIVPKQTKIQKSGRGK